MPPSQAAAEIITEVRRQFREVPGLKACIIKASQGLEISPEEDVEPDSDRVSNESTSSPGASRAVAGSVRARSVLSRERREGRGKACAKRKRPPRTSRRVSHEEVVVVRKTPQSATKDASESRERRAKKLNGFAPLALLTPS
eukprot:9118329-Pyramimonas_sp.AAC.2